ncbi:MAG TPA: hypothetical protein VN922_04015 [Bacteroidia bacterium]|nr:hypothetical protein [Bacteroidia bacterium]
MRNQGATLVNQLNTVQNNVQQLQRPAVPVNSGVPAANVTRVKPAKPEMYSGLRGTSPDEWLFSFEQYMKLTNVTDEGRKIDLVGTYFTSAGHALKWYRSVVNATPAGDQPFGGTWDTFKTQFLKRFKIIDSKKIARDKLAALKQWASVSKYNFEFTGICVDIDDMNEAEKLDRYIRGLKTPIRVEVELAAPRDMNDAMSKAQRIDLISFPVRNGTHVGTKLSNYSNGNGSSSSASNGDYAPMQLGTLSHRDERKYEVKENESSLRGNGGHLNFMGTRNRKPASRAQLLSRGEFARCMKDKLCLRCKKPGHFARNCTKQQQHPKGRAQ